MCPRDWSSSSSDLAAVNEEVQADSAVVTSHLTPRMRTEQTCAVSHRLIAPPNSLNTWRKMSEPCDSSQSKLIKNIHYTDQRFGAGKIS